MSSSPAGTTSAGDVEPIGSDKDITVPITEDTPEWWSEQNLALRECAKVAKEIQEMTDGTPTAPVFCYVTDPPGCDPTKTGRSINMSSISTWEICYAPCTDKLTDENYDLTKNKTRFTPKYMRLTDLGVIQCLCLMSGPERGERCPWDFTKRREVRQDRNPHGPTVTAWVNKLPFFLVYRGVYILSGGWNKFGWLINRPVQNGQQIKGGYPKQAEGLHVGLIVAPPAAVRDAALSFQVTGYGKMRAPRTTIWAQGVDRSMPVITPFNFGRQCLVINNEGDCAVQYLYRVQGFRPEAYAGAPATAKMPPTGNPPPENHDCRPVPSPLGTSASQLLSRPSTGTASRILDR
jgi:hypothetical protein